MYELYSGVIQTLVGDSPKSVTKYMHNPHAKSGAGNIVKCGKEKIRVIIKFPRCTSIYGYRMLGHPALRCYRKHA